VAKALRFGDEGKAVEELQRALNRCAEPLFYPPLSPDGFFGPATRFSYQALGFALGLTTATLGGDITVKAQGVFANPASRDQGQLRRAGQRASTLHEQTVAFDGTPTFWGLAKPLLRARQHGWRGKLMSSDRRQGVAERFGKSSQARLFDCFERFLALGKRCPADCGGNCNPANAPGASSHECFSDGTDAFGNRPAGTQLAWWELGLDVSDNPALLRALAALGYKAKLTYPNNPKESHHTNFTANPGPVLAARGPAGTRPVPTRPPRPRPIPVSPQRVLTGIDVSNHQPNVDWEAVKAAGHTFAFAKVSEGLGTPDRVFGKGRWKAMRDAGLVRGVYHFARPQKGRDPKDEVREFLGLVDAAGGFEDGDLVPVLDLEAFGKAGKLTAKQTLEWASGFAEEVHARVGRRPIIYTGVFWRETMGNPPDNLQCPLWLAAFVKDPKPFVPTAWARESFAIWQHTETGSTAGVPGNVDLNRLPGGEPALRRLRF
jgi:lysozyme